MSRKTGLLLIGLLLTSLTSVAEDLDLNAELKVLESKRISSLKVETPQGTQSDQQPGESIFDVIDQQRFSREITYNPEGKRDIFVVPWVVNAVNATRLLVLAEGYLEKNRLDKADEALRKILAQYPDTEFSQTALEKLKLMEEKRALYQQQMDAQAEEEQKRIDALKNFKIPFEVQKKMSMVVWDGKDSIMTYGDDFLRVGDVVPDLKELKILRFEKPFVYFNYKGYEIKNEYKSFNF